MITFPSDFPCIITNTSGGTLCGISAAGTLEIGPNDFESTRGFYASYAEEAYGYILDGTFSTQDFFKNSLDAGKAANAFSNARGPIENYASAGVSLRAGRTKEPTGFYDNDNVDVSYNATNRTITLTGNLEYCIRGVAASFTSPWTSPAHPDTPGIWYLAHNGEEVAWQSTEWDYSWLQIAAVYRGASDSFGIRKTHGYMPWQTHEAFTRMQGVVLEAGGDITDSSYTIAPETPSDSDNQLSLDSTTLLNSDLSSTLSSLTGGDGAYTLAYFSSPGVLSFLTDQDNITPLTNSVASYSDNGTLTETPSGAYVNVFVINVPVTSDANSQKYRYLFFPGTSAFSKLSLALEEDPRALRLGTGYSTLRQETFTTNQITLKVDSAYTSTGKFRIEAVQAMEPVRFSQVVRPVAEEGGGVVADPGNSDSFSIALADYTQSVQQLIWSTLVFVTEHSSRHLRQQPQPIS
jgi:hypothetical protein